jgi:hypothetical protein
MAFHFCRVADSRLQEYPRPKASFTERDSRERCSANRDICQWERDVTSLGDWPGLDISRLSRVSGQPDRPTQKSPLKWGLLILVFVVGILVNDEVSAALAFKDQPATKRGSSDVFSAVRVMQISGAKEIKFVVPDKNLVRLGEDVIKIRERRTDSGFQYGADGAFESPLMIGGQRSAASNDEKVRTVFDEAGIGSTVVDASNAHIDGIVIPEGAQQPSVFNANFWSVSGKKFGTSESDLKDSARPKPDGCDSQNGSEPSEHLRIIRDDLRRSVFSAFIFGCVGACICVAGVWWLCR